MVRTCPEFLKPAGNVCSLARGSSQGEKQRSNLISRRGREEVIEQRGKEVPTYILQSTNVPTNQESKKQGRHTNR